MNFKLTIAVLSLAFSFLMGPYQVDRSYAAPAVAPSVCTNCPFGSPACVSIGSTGISTQVILQFVQNLLENTILNLTNWIEQAWDQFIGAILDGFDKILELQFIQWQDNFYAYDLRPAMQDFMGQVNTGYIDQNRQDASFVDAALQERGQRALQKLQAKKSARQQPSGSMCTTGTYSGGFARANSFARAIRKASERDATSTMANDAGQPSEFGSEAVHAEQWERYCDFLVDPTNNGGVTGCPVIASPVETRNADIKPVKFLFDSQTIDVKKPEMLQALNALKENLVNITPPDPISPEALTSTSGQEAMLKKRSYIARKNAARSTIEYVASSRMPIADDTGTGDDLKTYIEELKIAAGTPLTELSDRYSYREIMNIMSREKFMTGQYNMDQIGSVENLQRESLVLSIFHLMHLREKFEVMERGILALAVQTSIELNQENSDSGTAEVSVNSN